MKPRRVVSFALHGLADNEEERWWPIPLDKEGLVTSDEIASLAWPREEYARAAARGRWPRAREVCCGCWQPLRRQHVCPEDRPEPGHTRASTHGTNE